MATRQVRICDRDGKAGAETFVLMIGAVARREDLCPDCSAPLREMFERMPEPKASKAQRRLEVVNIDAVMAARRTVASRRSQRPR